MADDRRTLVTRLVEGANRFDIEQIACWMLRRVEIGPINRLKVRQCSRDVLFRVCELHSTLNVRIVMIFLGLDFNDKLIKLLFRTFECRIISVASEKNTG